MWVKFEHNRRVKIFLDGSNFINASLFGHDEFIYIHIFRSFYPRQVTNESQAAVQIVHRDFVSWTWWVKWFGGFKIQLSAMKLMVMKLWVFLIIWKVLMIYVHHGKKMVCGQIRVTLFIIYLWMPYYRIIRLWIRSKCRFYKADIVSCLVTVWPFKHTHDN